MVAAGDESEGGQTEFPSGPRPAERNKTFLDDPVSDHLLRAVVALAMELSVTRERLAAMEAVLSSQGTLSAATIDNYAPDDSALKAREEARARLINSLIGPLVDHLASKAPD